MKLRLLSLIGSLFCAIALVAVEPAPSAQQPILVSVHGAWGGGWQMKQVTPLLEAKGWKV